MAIRVRTHTVGEVRLLVVEPSEPIVVGRPRLERLRLTADGSGPIDAGMLLEIHTHRPDVVVFSRGDLGPESEGLWRFDDDLSDAEFEELGYQLPRTQLPTWRAFARNGVVAYFHVGWSIREVLALEAGKRRLLEELEDPFDRWIIDTMAVFLVSTFEHVVRDLVPLVSRLKGRRASNIRRLAG